jgi:hypothetical protein
MNLMQLNKLDLLISKGQTALAFRQYHLHYDATTYYSELLFEKFKASKNQPRFLKLIWAFGVDWPCDKIELAKICPDICPIFDTPLDYGRGFNRVFNPNLDNDEGFYQPTIDHKVSRSRAKALGWTEEQINCIDNYVVVSRKANQWKSDMESKEELDHFYNGMIATYFS